MFSGSVSQYGGLLLSLVASIVVSEVVGRFLVVFRLLSLSLCDLGKQQKYLLVAGQGLAIALTLFILLCVTNAITEIT